MHNPAIVPERDSRWSSSSRTQMFEFFVSDDRVIAACGKGYVPSLGSLPLFPHRSARLFSQPFDKGGQARRQGLFAYGHGVLSVAFLYLELVLETVGLGAGRDNAWGEIEEVRIVDHSAQFLGIFRGEPGRVQGGVKAQSGNAAALFKRYLQWFTLLGIPLLMRRASRDKDTGCERYHKRGDNAAEHPPWMHHVALSP